jgi:hypothetical protein
VANGRSEVRDLVQTLLDDPALDSIAGYIDAQVPDVRPATVKAPGHRAVNTNETDEQRQARFQQEYAEIMRRGSNEQRTHP